MDGSARLATDMTQDQSARDMIEAAGVGEGDDPVRALSDALAQAGAGLAAARVGPQFLKEMVWAAPDPASIHPGRRVVDLVWREAFGGFRPAPVIQRSPDGFVHVIARAARPDAPPPDQPVYQGYSVAQLAMQMSPRNQVPDMLAEFRKWTREGAQARAGLGGLDIAYGPKPDNRLDLYRPQGVERPPVWVFIHGGYWQAATKDQHAQFCKGMLDAGFAVANIDYPLAPETPLAGIVTEVRAALRFLVREADNLSIDAGRLHVCGHSAGGHLTAWVASDPEGPPVQSALALSGIFDLEALRLIPMGRVLGLNTRALGRRLSPLFRRPRAGTRVRIAVGALESDEFKRQSAELAKAWGTPAPLHVEGANHFSLLDHLNHGKLLKLALEAARG